MVDVYRPLKNALGKWATGVGVATCASESGVYYAITVNSFTSVSLEPPLVLWCLERTALKYPYFMAAKSYGFSVLPAGAQDLSNRFASHDGAPLKADEFDLWETGAPILKERIAGFDCTIVARHVAGDHVVLVGEVAKFESVDNDPLIYFASQYR